MEKQTETTELHSYNVFQKSSSAKKMNLEKASGHTNDLILCFWIFMNGYNFVYAAKDQKKMLLKSVHLLYFIVDWSESLELILEESSAFAWWICINHYI